MADYKKPPKSSRAGVFLRYKMWLANVAGEGILGDGKYQLLLKIEELGSLKKAAESIGMSYRKAWGDIKKAEELLGYELTEKTRGGQDGGKSTLTPNAKKLLQAYEALHKKMDDAVEEAYDEFISQVKNSIDQ